MSEAATIHADSNGGLPLVGEDNGNRALWAGLVGIGFGALLLFTALEANRQLKSRPIVPSPKDYAYATAPRTELAIPEDYANGTSFVQNFPAATASPVPVLPPPSLVAKTRSRPSGDLLPTYVPMPTPVYAPPPPVQSDPGRNAPAIVYDVVPAAAAAVASAATQNVTAPTQAARAIAVGSGNRDYLVVQGTLIYAVLETALDSTQSGQARAMISRPVYNALGTNILIPRGSRIVGEYKAELGAGQNRAQVTWTRLIRPDGATIALDSPASDQLGRAGVEGRVDTHFGERLIGALLQSTLDFGAYAASRAVTRNDGVVVALPNPGQTGSSQLIQPPPKPTLRVRHGTRIAVFVARDLDFAGVE